MGDKRTTLVQIQVQEKWDMSSPLNNSLCHLGWCGRLPWSSLSSLSEIVRESAGKMAKMTHASRSSGLPPNSLHAPVIASDSCSGVGTCWERQLERDACVTFAIFPAGSLTISEREPRPLPRRRPLHPRSKIESYSAVLRVGRALVWFLHCLFWDELFEKVNDGPLFYYLRIIVSCMCQNNACFISLLESFCRCHFSCVLWLE